MKSKEIFKELFGNTPRARRIGALFSMLSTTAFFIYNFALGIAQESIWNISSGVYYFFLAALRIMIMSFIYTKKSGECADAESAEDRLFRLELAVLILTDMALAAPAALMVLSERSVGIGSIPAISTAAYTTYRVARAGIRFGGVRRRKSPLLFMLRSLELKDAAFSVLLLQSTLISVFGSGEDMLMLTSHTSAALMLLSISVTVNLALKYKKTAK